MGSAMWFHLSMGVGRGGGGIILPKLVLGVARKQCPIETVQDCLQNFFCLILIQRNKLKSKLTSNHG